MDGVLGICLLVGVVVSYGDCGAAQAYAPFIESLPPHHWQLARQVVLRDDGGAKSYHAPRIVILPAKARRSALYHEIGHLVFGADDYALQRRWNAELWDGDVPLGDLDNYPARILREGELDANTAKREDAAESYERYLMGQSVGKRRAAWLGANLPELRGADD